MLLTWKHSAGVGALVCTWYAISTASNNNTLAFASVGLLYFSGFLPTTIVPPFFAFMYTAYCSRRIGGRYLKGLLHPSATIPHSNFRNGCRLLARHDYVPSGPLGDHFKYFCDACRSGEGIHKSTVLVVPTPVFADNYAYLCFSPATKAVVAIDPADPKSILQMISYVSKLSGVDFQLTDVLCTHKHWDHAGGNEDLLQLSSLKTTGAGIAVDTVTSSMMNLVSEHLRIFGSEVDSPAGTNVWISEEDLKDGGTKETRFVASGAIPVKCIRSPGHTRGSIMYLVGAAVDPTGDPTGGSSDFIALFTGDCVFCGGCGAMFEVRDVSDVLTTYDAFHNDFLVSADPHTGERVDSRNVHVFVGHEYSEKLYEELCNTSVRMNWRPEAQNTIARELDRVKKLRKLRKRAVGNQEEVALPLCTVPSTLFVERRANPLLSVQRSALVELRRREERRSLVGNAEIERVIYTSAAR